jgi:thiol-disulfide isomerase/thioredoxin
MESVSYEKLIEISKDLLILEKEHNMQVDIQLDDMIVYEDAIKRDTKLYLKVDQKDDKYEEFMKSIEKYKPYLTLNNNDNKSFVFPKLTTINHIKNIMNENESFTMKNRIYLIHFWALWCGSGVDMLSEINKMNEESFSLFKDKVIFMSINLDDDFQVVKAFLNEARYDYMKHYWLEDGWNNDILKQYDITGIPEAIIVDINGSILDKDHPGKISIKKKLTNTINKHEQTSDQCEEISNVIHFDEREKLIEMIYQLIQNKELISVMSNFELKLSLIQKIQTQEDFTHYQANLIINALEEATTDTYIKKLSELIQTLSDKLNKNITNKASCTLKWVWNPKIGNTCKNCKCEIIQSDAKYICIICHNQKVDDYTFCNKCVPDAESEDIENPFHEHFLIYFPPDSDFMTSKMKNLMQKFDYDITRKEYMGKICNNCRERVNSFNFMCAVCNINWNGNPDSYDLCYLCFKISQDSNRRMYKEFDRSVVQHDNKTHPMMRYNSRTRIYPISNIDCYLKI